MIAILLVAVPLANKWYAPGKSCRQTSSMVSSWYGPGFHGRLTASGSTFDSSAMTVAHRTLPFGTRLRLVNPATNKEALVRVSDRGPYDVWKGVRYFEGRRDLDVSEGVARRLGMLEEGVATLQVEVLSSSRFPGPAPRP